MKSSLLVFAAIFVATYILLAFSQEFHIRKRAPLAWISTIILVILSGTPLKEIPEAINWNVLGIFLGMLPLAEFFSASGVPEHMAVSIADRVKSAGLAIVWLAALSGIISVFVENVATVLILAPIAKELAKRLKVPLTPIMVAVAISSNLQGTATLVGDPPSMLLAAFYRMNFLDFFFFKGRISIFWAVEAGALLSLAVLYLIFKKYKQHPPFMKPNPVRSYFPTVILVLTVLLLSSVSFFDPDFKFGAGIITLFMGIVITLWALKRKETTFGEVVSKVIDWDTFFLLMAIFVMVHTAVKAGLIDAFAKLIYSSLKGNVFMTYTVLVWSSVLASAFIDNVPYVAAMLPITRELAILYGNPDYGYLFAFGVLIGACLGGNITPVGAAANITAMSIVREEGENPSFWDFFKIGFPFTMAATFGGYIVTYLAWGV